MFAAILRAQSLLSKFAAERRPLILLERPIVARGGKRSRIDSGVFLLALYCSLAFRVTALAQIATDISVNRATSVGEEQICSNSIDCQIGGKSSGDWSGRCHEWAGEIPLVK